MKDLFRTEALGHAQAQGLGSIQLTRPLSFALLTGLAVAAAIAVLVFLFLGHYTRKARIGGFLATDRGSFRIVSPQSATVLESHVAEGKAVHQGEVLFVLAVDGATLGNAPQAAVQGSFEARQRSLKTSVQEQADLQATRLLALDRQIAALRTETQQMDGEAQLLQQRLELARQAEARLESLRGDNFVSSAQVQAKSEEVLALRVQVQTLARLRSAHLRDISTLESQRRELPLQTRVQQGELERDLAELTQLSAETDMQRRLVVRAPSDGVVSAVLADVGHSVGPTAALASLLPANARLEAQLYAPSSAVGFLQPDQTVLLRYQAFPYQKFGHQPGRVAQVSRAPLQASELAALSLPANLLGAGEPLYRITVRLESQVVNAYGRAQPLVPGMQLDADVLLDRRRLIEWIFEPLLGVAGRV